MDQKKEAREAIIDINHTWCKGCGICIAFCPKEVYKADMRGHPEIIDAAKCILCMLCVERCPDFAIEITERAKLAAEGGTNENS
jgi:2-oxoglutarate ferredoxin oxidoreductase subunit delta